MQEILETSLLAAVAVLAAVLRIIGQRPKSGMTKKQKVMLWRILAASLVLLALQALGAAAFGRLGPAGRWVRLACYLADYAVIGHDILKKAFRGIRNGQVFDENFLMAVATIGALALAVYEDGDYLESIAVMLFYQVGEWFQSYAVGRSRRNISDLMDIRPDYANVEQDGRLERVDPDEVAVGTVIVVQPGEKVPIDGVVTEGSSALNTAALTGESLPRDVGEGDEIISGCINMTGVLKLRTTREFGESTVSKILDLVENASSRKSKSEDFISRFARIYTPAVCGAALALAILPPLVRVLGMGLDAGWETWIYRALTFLVASCPCALVISIPLSFFAGIGGASKAGVLVKGSNYLELLSRTRTVVFDKTGTLTRGVFEVSGIHHSQLKDGELLEYAALAESASSHPISRSLQRACGKELDRSRVADIREIGGEGVTAAVDGHAVAAGNDKLIGPAGHPLCPLPRRGDDHPHGHRRPVYGPHPHLRRGEAHVKAGHPGPEGRRRPQDRHAHRGRRGSGRSCGGGAGRGSGVQPAAPGGQGGEGGGAAGRTGRAGEAGLRGRRHQRRPRPLPGGHRHRHGALGSDAAIEAADVVLMDDDPMKIAKAIKISRKCLGIVYQNIVFAIGIKLACLLLVALGLASMWLAVFADVGVMILAVLNAIRALFVKDL